MHGDLHRNMLRRTPRATARDIANAYDTVAAATGTEPQWFRPPFGILSFSALRAAHRHGMSTVLWTTWGRDWRREATPDTVVADVTRRYLDGGTVLLHDSDCESYPGRGRPRSARCLASRTSSPRAGSPSARSATTGSSAPGPPRTLADMAIVLALLAGLSYAGASVLQQRVASEQRPELSLRPALLLALARRPLWLLGIALDIGAYGLEAGALATGTVVTVGAAARERPAVRAPAVDDRSRGDASPGTSGSRPSRSPAGSRCSWPSARRRATGRPRRPARGSLPAPLVALVTASLVALAVKTVGPRRALYLAVATGAVYGFTAVLTKATVDLFDDGVLQVLGHWQLYVLLAVSAVGLLLNQSAFQAGHVAASLPAIAVTNPVLQLHLRGHDVRRAPRSERSGRGDGHRRVDRRDGGRARSRWRARRSSRMKTLDARARV